MFDINTILRGIECTCETNNFGSTSINEKMKPMCLIHKKNVIKINYRFKAEKCSNAVESFIT